MTQVIFLIDFLIQMYYHTRKIEISEINGNFTMKLPLITKYMMDLNLTTLHFGTPIHQKWSELQEGGSNDQVNLTEGKNLVIIDIRLRSAHVDTWNEEMAISLFSLMAGIGGTLGLCAGISFISALFLFLFFGNAFYHLTMSVILWFWWNVYQGQPDAVTEEEIRFMDERLRVEEIRRDEIRPFRSTGHMRAVSKVIQNERKSVIYDPWVAAQRQYGRAGTSPAAIERKVSLITEESYHEVKIKNFTFDQLICGFNLNN